MPKRLLLVVVMGLGLGTLVTGLGNARLRWLPTVPAFEPSPRTGDPVAGERLGRTVLVCTECHGEDLGGAVMIDAPLFARVAAPSLTRRFELVELDRAVRHGLGRNRALVLMPSDGYRQLTDQELADVGAWLEHLPPANRDVGSTWLGPFGVMAMLAGSLHVPAFSVDHSAVPSRATDEDERLLTVSGCVGCHGADLKGRELGGGLPRAPALVGLPGGRAAFERAVRGGRGGDGRELAPVMPWRAFADLSDSEVDSLWRAVEHR
ncbi:MAG: cytochrome c [Myxococcaceae bacterium]|nr:cytochrome c [Myxococcaceae bacterium]